MARPGYDLATLRRPSTILGRSKGERGSTATLTQAAEGGRGSGRKAEGSEDESSSSSSLSPSSLSPFPRVAAALSSSTSVAAPRIVASTPSISTHEPPAGAEASGTR